MESSPSSDGGRQSPPTSPLYQKRDSPPTSPPGRPSSGSSPPSGHERSPSSSPLHMQSSDSSPSTPPKKRRKQSRGPMVSRTTLLRRLRTKEESEESEESEGSPDEHAPEENRNTNPAVAFGEPDGRYLLSGSDSSSSSEDLSSGSSDESALEGPVSFCDIDSDVEVDRDADSDDDQHNSNHSDDESVDGSDEDEKLYDRTAVSTNEAILKALQLYIKQRWTKSSLNETVKLIKSLLPLPNSFPSSGKKLLSKLNKLSAFQVETDHFYCCKCQTEKASETEECECRVNCECRDKEKDIRTNCDCQKTGVFFEFSTEAQLKHHFEHRGLASAIDQYYAIKKSKEGSICDITDGSEYIKVRSKLKNKYDVVLLGNTDGVELSTSSKQELWPVLCVPCEVLPSRRSSFIIVSGVYVDKVKPKMNTFLRPFVNALKSIHENGGITWIHPQTNNVEKSEAVCPVLSLDAPAKAIVLNARYFSHRFGCNLCEQKAVKVKLPEEPAEQVQETQRKKKQRQKRKKTTVRRFVYSDVDAPLRTGASMDALGELAELRQKSRKGMLGSSVISELPYLDRGLCLSAEYLHVVLLGVGKYFLNLMINVRGPWYIGNKRTSIDAFLKSIKVPDFVKRLPRGLHDFKYLKGSELRALLLFYSLPAFEHFLAELYFQHWMLLVASINILLKDCITEDDLNAADIMLRCFVRDVGKLYHPKYYTYNVHNLLHLCTQVRRWGCLWSTAAFCFETFNGFITSHVHGTKHLGRELLNNIKIIQSTKVLENMLQDLSGIANQQKEDIELCGRELLVTLSNTEKLSLSEVRIENFQIFDRIKFKSNVLTSRHYDEHVKRANSFIQFNANLLCKYGEILHFVRDKSSSQLYCLVNLFKVLHTKIFFLEESLFQISHIVPVESSGEIIVIPVTSIVTKVIKAGIYLCLRPNAYEVNL